MMIYIDSMGQWEMVELGNEVMLVPFKVRRWPEDDIEFLGLAHIKWFDLQEDSKDKQDG